MAALALSDVPTFPDVTRTLVLDDKVLSYGALDDLSRLGPSLMALPFGSTPRGW